MGTPICLGVGKMEIDWGKNNAFSDHSVLFKAEDIKPVPYYYVDEAKIDEVDSSIQIEYKEGLSRSLDSIKGRLNLLGYTIRQCERIYNELVCECELHSIETNLSFNRISKLLKEIDVGRINTPRLSFEYDEYGFDLGEFVRRCIIPDKEIHSSLLKAFEGDEDRITTDLSYFFENMDPYVILRLLAENPRAKELDVYWAYADLVDSGWALKTDIVKPLPLSKRILIVTEGSSDSKILKKAITVLYPEISDFFSFIDMKDNYPFTGTGNLYNFSCGLLKLGILNNIIILFDNDCAGNEKYNKLTQLPKQSNILIAKLPFMKEFTQFDTVGPQGKTKEDINGTATSIECFLDFDSVHAVPLVRWTSFSYETQKYQGALERKEEYIKRFLKADLLSGKYDTTKIRFLIDSIIQQWCEQRQ